MGHVLHDWDLPAVDTILGDNRDRPVPERQDSHVPAATLGEPLTVFVFRDSTGRLRGTWRVNPSIELGAAGLGEDPGPAAHGEHRLQPDERAAGMGRAGRERALADFGWDAIARRTLDVYAPPTVQGQAPVAVFLLVSVVGCLWNLVESVPTGDWVDRQGAPQGRDGHLLRPLSLRLGIQRWFAPAHRLDSTAYR